MKHAVEHPLRDVEAANEHDVGDPLVLEQRCGVHHVAGYRFGEQLLEAVVGKDFELDAHPSHSMLVAVIDVSQREVRRV